MIPILTLLQEEVTLLDYLWIDWLTLLAFISAVAVLCAPFEIFSGQNNPFWSKYVELSFGPCFSFH